MRRAWPRLRRAPKAPPLRAASRILPGERRFKLGDGITVVRMMEISASAWTVRSVDRSLPLCSLHIGTKKAAEALFIDRAGGELEERTDRSMRGSVLRPSSTDFFCWFAACRGLISPRGVPALLWFLLRGASD